MKCHYIEEPYGLPFELTKKDTFINPERGREKDSYTKKYVKAIKKSLTENELISIINRIYEDGFEDGTNEGSK